jgi:uncharacterized protein (DUF427 family)
MNIAANPSPGFQRNPTRSITVEPFSGVVTVRHADAIIASTDRALVLREENYPAIFYIPFEDIYFEFLKRTDASTHCPYKGDASYWSIQGGPRVAENAVWSYETPHADMAPISGYLAFYADRVDAIEERPPDAPR